MNMQSKVIFGLMIPLGFALAAGTWFRWLPRWMWGSRPQETESDKNITKQIKHSGKYENGTNLIARHNLDAELAASSLNRWLSSSDIDWLARGSLGYENHLPAAVIPSSIHMRMTKKAYWYVVQSPDIPSKSLKVDFIESKKQIEIVGSHEDRFESHQEDLLTSLSEESSLEDSFVDMFFRRGMYDFMVDPFISRIKTVSESENKSGPRVEESEFRKPGYQFEEKHDENSVAGQTIWSHEIKLKINVPEDADVNGMHKWIIRDVLVIRLPRKHYQKIDKTQIA